MFKLLWLASWYPNETDHFTGDFIQRQAKAVSRLHPLLLVFVGRHAEKNAGTAASSKNTNLPQTGDAYTPEPGLEEHILYFDAGRPGFTGNSGSLIRYFTTHFAFFRELKNKKALPDLVHVQVAMRSGMLALYLKWRYGIPYVLTEHWSGYFRRAKDNLYDRSFLTRWITKRILHNAEILLPVSDELGNQINRDWAKKHFLKIPNVVDTRLFYPAEKINDGGFRFIHISSMVYPKNTEAIIRSFAAIIREGIKAELLLVGPLNDSVNQAVKDSGEAATQIRSIGMISYDAVARELRTSSALILFSHYENLSCVILESLCCGVPVISSRVGGIPEAVNERNGILVEAGNEKALEEAMKKMILYRDQYDSQQISRDASALYAYETVARKILDVYDKVLEKK